MFTVAVFRMLSAPPWAAELPLIVVLVRFKVPARLFKIPPPSAPAILPVTALLLTVTVPVLLLKMPPPEPPPEFPLLIVSPLIVMVIFPEEILKMR